MSQDPPILLQALSQKGRPGLLQARCFLRHCHIYYNKRRRRKTIILLIIMVIIIIIIILRIMILITTTIRYEYRLAQRIPYAKPAVSKPPARHPRAELGSQKPWTAGPGRARCSTPWGPKAPKCWVCVVNALRNIFIYIYIHIYIYTYVYACIYVCTHLHVYIYIYT